MSDPKKTPEEMPKDTPQAHDQQVLSEEYKKRQRRRSAAIAIGLVGLVASFYILTMVKLGPELFSRAL
ncbi:MAG TPA: hypothetical protein ENK61_01210 [Devosia sp.]|nr:hypothetical protein [Devosia sp.]